MKAKYFCTCFITFVLLGCSQQLIKIDSSPTKATVSLYNPDSKDYEVLGLTPLVFDKEMKKKLKGEFVSFQVQKPGHITEHLALDRSSKKNFVFRSQLKKIETWTDREDFLSSRLANDITEKVQRINTFILKKDFHLALNVLSKLMRNYPQANIFYDIQASIYILMGDKKRGIASLKKSLSINPGNVEAEKMLKGLEGTRGR